MGYTLLLADDSVTTHRVMELTFAGQGIRVMAVADGEQALDRMRTTPPDILLAEVALPSVDGYKLTEHVRSTPVLADVPVLLLTGAFDEVDEARVSASGAAGIIIKPFEPEVVIKRVKDLLGISPKEQDSSSTRLVTSNEPPAVTERFPDVQASPTSSVTPSETARVASAPSPAPAGANADRQIPPSATSAASPGTTTSPVLPEPTVFEIDEQWFGDALEAQRSRVSAEPTAASTAGNPPAAAPDMADSFHAFLAAEQGDAPAPAPLEPVAISDDAVERIAARVAERLAAGVFVDTVRRVVEEVAERLVREEIARIRAKVDAQKQQ